MRDKPGRPGHGGTITLSAVAMVLVVALVPAGAGSQQATISWSKLWHWLTGHSTSLALPAQQSGTAAGKPHHVPGAATRAGRGTGHAPGRGAGQLAPFTWHAPKIAPAESGPGFGNGSRSFSARTSLRVPAKSSATSTLFRNTDGTYTKMVYAGPVNYRSPDGGWQPISTTLRRADGRYQETANSFTVSLAASAGSQDLVAARFGPATLAYGLAGAVDVPVRISGSTATYDGVLPSTSLVLSARATGLVESLVLAGPKAPSSWTFPLRLRGLTARLAADGSVEFVTQAGVVVARVPRGYLRDSSAHHGFGGPAVSRAVSYQLVAVGGQPALRMTASQSWLRDPARVFPVTVDPNFTASGTTEVDNLYPGDSSSMPDMDIGSYNGGGEKSNSYLAFAGLGSALSGQHVTSANLHVFDYWASTCTPEQFSVAPVSQSWPVSSSKSWPGPSFGGAIGSLTANPGAACGNTGGNETVGTWMTVGLSTGTFNSWTTGGADNGLAIYADDGSNVSWKRFSSDNGPNPPYLELNFTPDAPPQIDAQYPPDNYNAPTLTPELLATGHDPDNWPNPSIQYDFTVYNSSGTVLADSGKISGDTWIVPVGKLSWSQTYYWTVQAWDGWTWSNGATTSYFTTAVPQPLITSGLAQNSDGHGFDPSIGNYTTSATDASVRTVGPALMVQRDYNSLDPRTTGAFGAGWSTTFDMKAAEVRDASNNLTSVIITYPNGQEVGFGANGDGSFTPPLGRFATLTSITGGYKLVDKSGTTYTFTQGTASPGVDAISSIADYEGRTLTFAYSGNQLTTVTSAISGRALHFTWTTPSGAQSAHVQTVATDPATPGNPATAQTWTYAYAGDELTGVCPPTSSTACTTYAYAADSHYRTTVLDAGPYSYWRFSEAPGASTAVSEVLVNEGNDAASYGPVTLGQPGPLPGSPSTAAAFDGSSSYVALKNGLVQNSTYLSISMWFSTTGNGVLFSTDHDQANGGNPGGGAMPVLYVGTDGKLYGHYWNNTVPGIASASPVNDGAWHHVVLSGAGTTQTLYLDGQPVGTLSGQLANVDPYNIVGAGVLNSNAWPATPSRSGNIWWHFSGKISDVAFYNHPLTAPIVAQQYASGHTAASVLTSITAPSGNKVAQVSYDTSHDRVSQVTDNNGGTWTLNAPAVTGSSRVYRAAVLGSGPQDYWRLSDTGGTQPVNEVHGGSATYANVTLGTAGAFGANDVTAASFNGSSSSVRLPPGLFPAASTQEVWFTTTSTGGVLLSAQSAALGGGGTATPVMWISADGRLRGLNPNPTPTGPFVSGLPGKCIDDSGGGTANGTHVQLWDCLSTSNPSYQNQSWTLFADGTIRDFGKCMDISGGGTANGTHVQLWDCDGGAGQVWQVTAGGALRNPASGRCLDDPDANTTSGTQLQIWDCDGQQNQTWIQSVGATRTGPFTSGIAGKCIDNSAGGSADGNHVQLWDCGNGNQNQSWTLNPDGTLRILGKCMDISGGGTANGTKVQLWECNAGAGQVWQVTANGALRNPASGRCLDDPNSSSSNGAQLQIWDCNGHPNQTWTQSLASPAAVNDGKWHHAVLTGSGTSQSLYLDGTLVMSTTGYVNLLAGTGQYAYLGAGDTGASATGLPVAATVHYSGSLEEAAFYRSALTSADVARHYAAFKSSLGSPAPVETVQVTDPGGNGNAHVYTYAYDPSFGDRIVSITDPTGGTTSYGYDKSGFEYTVTDPNGNVTTTGHDVRGNVVSQTTCQNQPGNVCSTVYHTYYPDDTTADPPQDPRNDLVLTTRDGRSSSSTDNTYLTSYSYDAAGDQTGVTTPPVPGFPAGRTTTTVYTDGTSAFPAADSGNAPAGLLASSTTPGGAKVTITYFRNGDPAQLTDPAGEVTTFTYDALGRVLTKTVTSDSYPSGLTTSYGYDGLNRTVAKTDPARTDRVTGAVHIPKTTTVFDVDGNVTSVTVADLTGGDASRTTSNTYDSSDRLATTTDAAGQITTYGYDAYGNMIKEVDPAGHETDYTYDPLGHLLTTTLAGYTGDPANPSPATNLVENSRAYDPAGRLASVTDSMGWVTAYTYTDNGLAASVTREDPAHGLSFVQQANTYDAAGNLIQRVTNNGATTTAYTVDAAGRTTSTTLDPSGLHRTTTTSYSPDDYVVNAVQTDPAGAIAATDYTYDPLGRETSRTVHDDTPGHPVGWWKLADGTGTAAADSSGAGQTGYLTGTGLSWGSGQLNGTGGTGGTGSVTTAGPVVDTSKSFSLSAWVHPAAVGSAWQGIVTAQGSQNGVYVEYDGGTGKWGFSRALTDTASPGFAHAESPAPAQAGVWTHLVATFDATSGTMTLYVNGTPVATATDSTPFAANGPLVIGRGFFNGGALNYFNGAISDVQVYSRALSATDVTTLYGYGRTSGALDAHPLTTSWTLDHRGLPTAMTDPDGNTTTYSYDEAGRLAVVTGPAANVETNGGSPVLAHPVSMTGYDTFGEQAETSDPNGNLTTYAYDSGGHLVSTTMPSYIPPGSSTALTAVRQRSYNSLGQLTSATDPLGNVTSYAYDQLGDLTTVTQPGGGVTHTVYDTNGDKLSVTDPTGAQTQATYDYLGHQLTSTQMVRQPSLAADTTTSSYADPAGFLSSTTSPTGVTNSYTYNAAGQPTKVVDGAGNATTYGYDFLGRTIQVTAPDSSSQTVAYDEAGRPVAHSDRDTSGNVLRTVTSTYDANSNVLSTTDALGHTTTFSYDASNAVTSEVQPVAAGSSITTSFGYDAVGNRTRFTDGRGNAFITTYNTWNLPESTVEPATPAYPSAADRTFTTAYDADGRVATQTSPGNVVVASTYDDLGDLTGQNGSGAGAATVAHAFGYDAAGRVTSAGAPGGNDTFSYDDRGLLLSASGPSGTSAFTYNASGQMTSRADASGTSSYSYDIAGRLSTISDASTGTALTFGYNSLSMPSSIGYGSGADTRSFGYDSLHRLSSDTLKTAAGATVASVSYGYDLNNNETSKVTAGFTGASSNTYTYDWANRLTSWNNGTTSIGYGYDASGNRTQVGAQAFSYDARNELTSDGSATYAYTARGTLASTTPNGGSPVTSASDAFNRVITAGSQTYAYDSLDRVVTAGGVTFSYSGTANDAASDGIASYSRDPNGGLIGVKQGVNAALAFTDLHTDVIADFTASGASLLGSTTYDPFGNITASSGALGNVGYQSAWTDTSTGKVDMAARWYNPATGQFTSRDTAGLNPVPNSVTADRFAYVNDNPLTGGDPSGHCDWWNPLCGALQVASNAWNAAQPALSTAWNATTQFAQGAWNGITSAASSMWNGAVNLAHNIWNGAQQLAHTVGQCFSDIGSCAQHVATTIVNTVNDVTNTVRNGFQTVWHATQYAVTHPVQAITYAYSAARTFVQHHAADIVSFVASTAVFMGCEGALGITTFGVGAVAGAVACGAAAGAVGSAVNYAMTTPMSKWNAADFGKAVAGGAFGGAVGGLLGSVGGELMSSLGSKLLGPALRSIADRLGPAAVDDTITTAADDATSAAGNAGAGGDPGAGPSAPSDSGPSPDAGPSTEPNSSAPSQSSPSSAPAESSPTPDSAPGKPSGPSEPSSTPDQPASCGGESFTAATKVLLASGAAIPISQLKPGDMVVATDVKTGKTSPEAVADVLVNHDTDLYDLTVKTAARATVIHTTSKHRFWDPVARRWVQAARLQAGEPLLTADGTTVTADGGTVPQTRSAWMWDLTIPGGNDHDFYVLTGTGDTFPPSLVATAVLVHNDNGPGGDDGPASSRVPDLTGKTEAEADQILDAEGFGLHSISQSGAYATYQASDGSRVTIRLSDGRVTRTSTTDMGPNIKNRTQRWGPDGNPTDSHDTGENLKCD